jgi:hypothetical protein
MAISAVKYTGSYTEIRRVSYVGSHIAIMTVTYGGSYIGASIMPVLRQSSSYF